jgi:SAM-dependent methyltransferase
MILDRVQEVLRDRRHRSSMSQASYWDARVRTRTGHARSVWHSQAFSEVWNLRQMAVLDDALAQSIGSVASRRILDVGCGTGRITRELARRGALAVGVDFSEAAIDAARREGCDGGSVSYEVGNVTEPPLPFDDASFDAVVAVGCLAVACTDLLSLERALAEMRRVVREGAPVVLLEPIHSSRLLGRVLKARVAEWIAAASRAGLQCTTRRGMGFVPVRLALSSFDLPAWFVGPVFRAGETTLDALPLQRMADYTLLSFVRPARAA